MFNVVHFYIHTVFVAVFSFMFFLFIVSVCVDMTHVLTNSRCSKQSMVENTFVWKLSAVSRRCNFRYCHYCIHIDGFWTMALLRTPPTNCVEFGDFHLWTYRHIQYMYMVVDLKVLDRIVDDDDPEHIKISFGESFFSSWRKYFFLAKDLAKD